MDLLPPLEIDDEEIGENELKSAGDKSLSSLTIVDGFNDDPFLNVDFCSFKLRHLLGRGSYSDVWKAKCKDETVALKVINSTNDVLRGIFYHEVEAMRNLVHPNVVEIMGACVCPVYAIVMEYMTCGSLDQLLHESKNISYKADHAFDWASQCADAMAYIHRKGFAHGDLKTANLLLDDNCHCLKVADFGTMVYMSTNSEYRQGSAPWMAPEVYAGLRPPRIQNIPTKLMQMIERCWQKLPEERPSIKEIRKVLYILCEMYPNSSEPLTNLETNSKQKKEATYDENGFGNVECCITEKDKVTRTDLDLSPSSIEEIEVLNKKYDLSYNHGKVDK